MGHKIRRKIVIQLLRRGDRPASLSQLAIRLECGRMTIYRHLRALQAEGVVSVSSGAGRGVPNVYQVNREQASRYVKIS